MKRNQDKKTFRIIAITMSLLMLFAFAYNSQIINALAEGSRNLTATRNDSSWVSNSGYRPYTEWYNASTAGIPRKQIIKVFVNSGEIMYFGSSVSEGSGGDIVVRRPDGTSSGSWNLNVVNNGRGHINTRAKEIAGPNYSGSGNTGGYTPLSITVDQTGVWEFEFHSTGYTNVNPTFALVTDNNFVANQTTGTVAAWDITVTKLVGSQRQAVPGRVFVNYLSLNMGNNRRGENVLHSVLYVLTYDGYIYQTDFNGIDPYGFVFFANNRGLINGISNSSLLASGVAINNDMSPITSNGIDVQFHSPIHPDTMLDHTHKIFFEMPADDLPSYIKPTPQVPGTITDFHFKGFSDNIGYVGEGGYFYFTADKASSFEIKLDFTNYKNPLGVLENRGIIYLANTCVQGQNKIYWNGRDANGNILPAGLYGRNNDVEMTVVAKAGVYHFPMFDVENNRNGIKIRLMNTPRDSNGNLAEVSELERCTVYYNNQYLPNMTAADSGASLNQLEGYDSRLGASKFGVTATNNPGDYAAVDLWASYTGESDTPVVVPDNFELIESPTNILALRGLVFYDNNNDAQYRMINGDYAMAKVQVDLYKDGVKIASDTTDVTGMYHFGGLEYGTYQVRVTNPIPHAVCTTNNINQNVIVGTAYATDGVVRANDVGFYYQLYDNRITVRKEWETDWLNDPVHPENIQINVNAKNGTDIVNTYTANLSAANGWQHTFSDLPKYASDGTTLLTYEVEEVPIDNYYLKDMVKVTTPGYETYTFTNATKGIISVSKVDAEDESIKLEGAVFEFWKRGTTDTLIATKTTDANGLAFVSDLDAGTYFIKEISAPDGYYFEPANAQSADFTIVLDSTDYHQKLVMSNRLLLCDFVLEKKILTPSDNDESFIFEIVGPDGVQYAAIVIPAGESSKSISFVDMPGGIYTIREVSNSNWRYELVEDQTLANDGTTVFEYSSNQLEMPVVVPDNENYHYLFVSEKTRENWLSDNVNVTNEMRKP